MKFYIVATGPSINDLTQTQRDIITNGESLSFSHIPFANIKTKYYMLCEDLESCMMGLNKAIENKYTDSILISNKLEVVKHSMVNGYKKVKFIRVGRTGRAFNGSTWFDGMPKPDSILPKFGSSFRQELFNFRGQLSVAINIAYLLEATDIRLVGVDLNNNKHFYDSNPDLKFIADRYNTFLHKKSENYTNKDFDSHHTTDLPLKGDGNNIAPISVFLGELRKELEAEGKTLTCCSKGSKLVRDGILEYSEID